MRGTLLPQAAALAWAAEHRHGGRNRLRSSMLLEAVDAERPVVPAVRISLCGAVDPAPALSLAARQLLREGVRRADDFEWREPGTADGRVEVYWAVVLPAVAEERPMPCGRRRRPCH